MLYERVSPYVDHVVCGGQFSIGAAHRYVGLLSQTLGDTSQAYQHFAEGMALNDQIDAPICAARTRLDWAKLLIARRHGRDLEKARLLGLEAAETAGRLGCTLIERRAELLVASI